MKIKQIATISAGYPFRSKISEIAGSGGIAGQMKDISSHTGICCSSCIETALTGKREPDYLTAADILVAARGKHNYVVQVDQTLASSGRQALAAPHFFKKRAADERHP